MPVVELMGAASWVSFSEQQLVRHLGSLDFRNDAKPSMQHALQPELNLLNSEVWSGGPVNMLYWHAWRMK